MTALYFIIIFNILSTTFGINTTIKEKKNMCESSNAVLSFSVSPLSAVQSTEDPRSALEQGSEMTVEAKLFK